MTILYAFLGIVALCYVSAAGLVLLTNFFTSRNTSFWSAIFHRCTPLEKLALSPGLLWVLPLTAVAYLVRKFGR
jgi:hypothetical protein